MQNVIIAGNGPSLQSINYQRLPKKYDIFRCNQFYFEDKYYLGKNIKTAFLIYTLSYSNITQLNNQYLINIINQIQTNNIEKLYCLLFKVIKTPKLCYGLKQACDKN